jgi:hypothetical protein
MTRLAGNAAAANVPARASPAATSIARVYPALNADADA